MENAFLEEIATIKNQKIKEIVSKVLANVPEYFYVVPASSSGKYHPAFALGDGGLYRHVKAAVRIANHMMSVEQSQFTQDEKDMIVASLILHDCWKQGEDSKGSTIHEHPVVAARRIKEIMQDETEEVDLFIDKICGNISSHLGQWNISIYSTVILPKPITAMEKFVHICDYMASRKDIIVLNV